MIVDSTSFRSLVELGLFSTEQKKMNVSFRVSSFFNFQSRLIITHIKLHSIHYFFKSRDDSEYRSGPS